MKGLTTIAALPRAGGAGMALQAEVLASDLASDKSFSAGFREVWHVECKWQGAVLYDGNHDPTR